MKFGLKINRLEQLNNAAKYKYIYFGNEFCEKKLPTIDFSKKVIDFCQKNDKIPVLMLPFLTEFGFKKAKELIDNINKLIDNISNPSAIKYFEITINDYGILDHIKKFPNIKLNLGRLLIKMKKGPEIMSGALRENHEKFKENSLNNPMFIDFIKKHGISRFEVDLPPQGRNLPKHEKITLYLGNSVLSVTKRCPYIDSMKSCFKYEIKECLKECLKFYLVKNTKYYSENIYVMGNAEFQKTEKQIPKEFKKCIDRIVLFPSMQSLL